jgi:hypothetical protein
MSLTYIQAISIGFPAVQCHALGDGSMYSNIVWDAGSPLPSQSELDNWIAANPTAGSTAFSITKYEFRKLFTLAERVAVDNVQANTAIPAQYRAMLLTMAKDLELSAVVELHNPDVAAGVGLLESLGLIGVGRAARILSNLPPL